MDAISQVHVTLPAETHVFAATGGESATGMSISAAGTGSFTGLSYTVPPYTKGKIDVAIQMMCLTSDNIADLNKLVMSMLSASQQSKVTHHSSVTASADLSFWDLLLGGGASASYNNTTDSMQSMGLTTEQIDTIIDKLFDIASKMNHVKLKFDVDNSNHDFSVSGDLELYTISGTVKTDKGTVQYRMLANQGTAGEQGSQAKTTGKVIPMN